MKTIRRRRKSRSPAQLYSGLAKSLVTIENSQDPFAIGALHLMHALCLCADPPLFITDPKAELRRVRDNRADKNTRPI
jgi:hypothetical protein